MPSLDEMKDIVERMQREVDKAKQLMTQFDGAVNELNNLLAVMHGNAQLAQRSPTAEAQSELINVVLASTARARQIVRDTLSAHVTAAASAPSAKEQKPPVTADILIVDDEKLLCSMVGRVLSEDGHTVAQAYSGQEALEYCQKKAFDIIFLDVRLRDMSGIEVWRRLRRTPVKPCVIFFSGDPTIQDPALLIRQEGADGFIRKPFDINEIKNVVFYILSKRTARGTRG